MVKPHRSQERHTQEVHAYRTWVPATLHDRAPRLLATADDPPAIVITAVPGVPLHHRTLDTEAEHFEHSRYDLPARDLVHLATLPGIDLLRQRCKALAVLERIIDGGEPYYVYTSAWGEDEAALMSNGSGDEWAAVFTAEGVFVRVFHHESAMSPYRDPDHELWPGLLDGLPTALLPQLEEPAFGDETGQFLATAVLWQLTGDDHWQAGEGIDFPPQAGPDDGSGPDGSGMLDILLDDIVDRYIEFATDYYQIEMDPAAVEHVLAHRPLTDDIVRALNPRLTVADLRKDIATIGYPIART